MNDTITIMGFIGNDPGGNTTAGGVPVVNFRVGSSQSRYDAKTQTWIDTGTNWYNVSAYRQLAVQARASLQKGHPVIVTGRLRVRDWDNGTARGTSLDIDAEAIGHDLRWGTSAFVRNRPPAARTSSSDAVDSVPAERDPASESDLDEDADRDGEAEVVDPAWGLEPTHTAA
ncbi:single-stranded DNA-binding protein [Microbacterium sp. M28]|uniref:single-stranded DNA-binding protein n=1 Tax=Microbacterium sp. M28 TaxID=2962064 RepID=UPI0021F446EB|nr:single-stranded DNA-binding protein [Microbacterium sp. M28]UYO98510.1 single-stranded DNA-binding protein [Microbacterium sp. M28]